MRLLMNHIPDRCEYLVRYYGYYSNLPVGATRDDAIIQLSNQWRNPTAAQTDLIASIGDRRKRGQAKIIQIYRVMQTDPARARKLLEDEDIPSQRRAQLEMEIAQIGLND